MGEASAIAGRELNGREHEHGLVAGDEQFDDRCAGVLPEAHEGAREDCLGVAGRRGADHMKDHDRAGHLGVPGHTERDGVGSERLRKVSERIDLVRSERSDHSAEQRFGVR